MDKKLILALFAFLATLSGAVIIQPQWPIFLAQASVAALIGVQVWVSRQRDDRYNAILEQLSELRSEMGGLMMGASQPRKFM